MKIEFIIATVFELFIIAFWLYYNSQIGKRTGIYELKRPVKKSKNI